MQHQRFQRFDFVLEGVFFFTKVRHQDSAKQETYQTVYHILAASWRNGCAVRVGMFVNFVDVFCHYFGNKFIYFFLINWFPIS